MGILHLANELRLLRCTFVASQDSESASHVESSQAHSDGELNWDTCLQDLVGQIEAGEYFHALASQGVSALLGAGSSASFNQGGSQAENKAWFSAQKSRIKAIVNDQVSPIEVAEDDKDTQNLILLGVGVASLLAFLQANLTGPQVEGSVISADNGDVMDDSDEWARQQLMIDGSDLLGKLYVPEYLILAKYLLVDMKTKPAGLETRSWWGLRTLLTHQRCLGERSPTLQSLLRDLSSIVLSSFGTTEVVQAQEWAHILLPGEARILAAAAQLEAGFVEHAFGHDNKARACFERAEQTCGLELSVTGALGFRTIYQTDAKAQMVLLATSNSTAGAELDDWRRTSDVDTKAKSSNSEILLAPKLVEGGRDGDVVLKTEESNQGASKVLSTIEQAVVLAKCLDVQRSNPDDELRTWQMAPYIEAVNAQEQSDPMVRAFCELLRIRWERLRSRTKERAYAMMEDLAEELRRGTTKIALRMCHVFSVAFPMMPIFLKEQAELMVSFGLVGEAMRVFEELELWNNLIDCYTLLGKKAAAADLINQRLKSHPNDPRLWCSLGDVTLSDECYRKAWAVSNQHYARAQRSLGRTAYARKDYAKSMEHWKLALNLNPLHPDGWFALGSAAVKAHDVDTAINAFTRSVQLDPDNGESWNNLAALNMVRKRSKEAFFAFREALKYKRNSWQMWENFAQVSVDVSNFGQAVQALYKVLELSEGKRTDLITLTKIVEEVERLKSTATPADSTDVDLHKDNNASTIDEMKIVDLHIKQNEAHLPKTDETAEQIRAAREALTLFEMTGKLLNQVVQSKVSGGEVWGLKARWHRANGDLTMCTEAALKQVRAFQGTSWQHNQEKFESFATASLQLCEAYIETSQKGGSVKDASAAVMHLRNTLKQGQQFSGIDEYKMLEACLQRAEKIKASLLSKQQTA